MPRLLAIALFASLILATGCGGGGSSNNGNNGGGGGGGSVANSVPIVVNSGPTSQAVDTAFVSVTVCVPGTSTCQTIPNIAVDTGSMGLRVLKSALTLSLPQAKAVTGNPLVECAQFLSFFTWGPVMTADVKMAGEVASSAPIQVIGEADTGFPLNSDCAKTAPKNGDTLPILQANGILGIGPFLQDCGGACAPGSTNNLAFYYDCPTPSTCAVTSVATSQQVPNPVAMFAGDNNGTLIQLPSIPVNGVPSASGTLIFGIGTQSNNGLGSATVLTTDQNGTITTVFKGKPYPGSFIDSGSNGIFFLDSATTGLPGCTTSQGFYCPTTPANLSATNQGANNKSSTVNFTIIDIDDTTQAPPANFAFDDIGGTQPNSFDWGLAFFFGRNVFTAIETRTTPGGTGPFFAY